MESEEIVDCNKIRKIFCLQKKKNLLQRNVKRLQNEKSFSISELRPCRSEQNKLFYHSSHTSNTTSASLHVRLCLFLFEFFLFIYFTANVLHMKSFVFSIIKKNKKQYKIHSIAHNKSIALFQGTDETSKFSPDATASLQEEPSGRVQEWPWGSRGGGRGQWAGSRRRLIFYLLVGRDTKLISFLFETTLAGFQDVGAVCLTTVGLFVFALCLEFLIVFIWSSFFLFFFTLQSVQWEADSGWLSGRKRKKFPCSFYMTII